MLSTQLIMWSIYHAGGIAPRKIIWGELCALKTGHFRAQRPLWEQTFALLWTSQLLFADRTTTRACTSQGEAGQTLWTMALQSWWAGFRRVFGRYAASKLPNSLSRLPTVMKTGSHSPKFRCHAFSVFVRWCTNGRDWDENGPAYINIEVHLHNFQHDGLLLEFGDISEQGALNKIKQVVHA